MVNSNRICGEQSCQERTNRPSHPLCYLDYLDFQDGLIDECPNHPGVYKPAQYGVCRDCYFRHRKDSEKNLESSRTRVTSDVKAWDTPYSEANVVSPYAKAVERVRRNMANHSKECRNHESNTLHYLVEPMLRGLGWNFDDPEQVMTEYRPKVDQRRGKRGKAVDIALLENGTPTVFVEVKRLDRELDRDHSPDYEEQIEGYASHMPIGTAVLTNGQSWIISPVLHGSLQGQTKIDVNQGDPEQFGKTLHSLIGSDTQAKGSRESVRPGDIKDRLSDYRLCESRKRNRPAYTIFTNKTIDLIASQKPGSLQELARIKGVGPKTLEEHGDAVLIIING